MTTYEQILVVDDRLTKSVPELPRVGLSKRDRN